MYLQVKMLVACPTCSAAGGNVKAGGDVFLSAVCVPRLKLTTVPPLHRGKQDWESRVLKPQQCLYSLPNWVGPH